MSSRFSFAIADSSDDAQLRARMAEDRMEGEIAITFRREPSFFAAARVQGDATEIVKCVDAQSGCIVGLGSRSTAHAYLNCRSERIGYLSDLRAAPPYRGGTLLARGYRFLRELHERDPVPFYTTVIYEGNLRALQSLSGARAGLPVYCDWGLLLTPALRLDFGKPPIRLPGVTLVRGEDAEVQRIVEFLNTWQSRKQFAPVYRLEDFGSGRFFGLRGRDFFLAVSDGRIIGTVAAWDQSAARQTHVERYSRGLELIRPFYNCAALFCALKPLPQPGARIPYVYLACMAAENNDARLMRALLRYAYNALRIGQSHYAIAGLHERDPLAALLAEYRCVPAAGRLFVVHYAEQHERVAALAARVPYVEAGCL